MGRNVLYNLSGQLIPLGVAAVAVPFLLAGLGTDGFGMLAIAWMFLGSFSLFDLGLSRAATQLVSASLGSGRSDDVPAIIWTTLSISTLVGVAAGSCLGLVAPWLTQDLLTMPDFLRQPALFSIYCIAAAVPIIISAANLRGALEAIQRFDLVNLVRIPLGIASFALPLLVLTVSSNLFHMVLALVGARTLAWVAYFGMALRFIPGFRQKIYVDKALIRPLISFGGWMTISNVLSPIMVYLDRFLIGVLLTSTAVAYYATPWEVVTKLLIIPSALSSVLFPAFSFWRESEPRRAGAFFGSAMKGVLIILFPIVIFVIAFAEPLLAIWLNADFAAQSFRAMQILALGVLFNGAATIPFAFIQGIGRPDVTARIHLAELPVYCLILWFALDAYGIAGAAFAWTARVALDFGLLYFVSWRSLETPTHGKTIGSFAGAIVMGFVIMASDEVVLSAVLAVVTVAIWSTWVWKYLVDSGEKEILYRRIIRFSS